MLLSGPRPARVRRLVTVLLALALAFAGLTSLAPAASAATPTPTPITPGTGLGTDRTEPLSLGSPSSATLDTEGQSLDLTFDMPAGNTFALDVTSADLRASGTAQVRVSLFLDGGPSAETSIDVTGPARLRYRYAEGILRNWSLRIEPLGDTLGTLNFTARLAPDQVIPVTLGKQVKLTYTSDGAARLLRFPVVSGRRLTVGVTASQLSSPSGEPGIDSTLINPDGLDNPFGCCSGQGFFEPQDPLYEAGTWTLLLAPREDTAGSQTVKLNLVQPTSGTATLGQPFAVGTKTPGQDATYRVSVAAGQSLVVGLDSATLTAGGSGGDPGSAGIAVFLLSESGSFIAQMLEPGKSFGEYTDPLSAGTYELGVYFVSDTVGTARLTVRYPAVATTPLTLGRSTTASLTAGDVARFTFAATMGRPLGLQFTDLTWATEETGAMVSVIRPDGTVFTSWYASAAQFSETQPLDVRGTWAITVDPSGAATGSTTFTARQPADLSSTVTPDKPVTTRIRVPGQNARYAFQGVAGTRPTIDLTTTSMNSPSTPGGALVSYTLYRPDGTTFAQVYPGVLQGPGWSEFLPEIPLDATGTWTLVVDPQADTVGSQTFTLHSVTDLAGDLTVAVPKKITIGAAGQQAVYSFTWTGKRPIAWAAETSAEFGRLTLTSPDGAEEWAYFSADNKRGQFFSSTRTGTWTIRVDPDGAFTGPITLTLSKGQAPV